MSMVTIQNFSHDLAHFTSFIFSYEEWYTLGKTYITISSYNTNHLIKKKLTIKCTPLFVQYIAIDPLRHPTYKAQWHAHAHRTLHQRDETGRSDTVQRRRRQRSVYYPRYLLMFTKRTTIKLKTTHCTFGIN